MSETVAGQQRYRQIADRYYSASWVSGRAAPRL